MIAAALATIDPADVRKAPYDGEDEDQGQAESVAHVPFSLERCVEALHQGCEWKSLWNFHHCWPGNDQPNGLPANKIGPI